MRVIKDGIYVKEEYGQESYRIKTDITHSDRMLYKNKIDKLIPWDSNDDILIHSANLLGCYDATEFPPILEKQKELWYLALPSQLARKLNDVNFIEELRGIQIDGGHNLKLQNETLFPHLLYLSIDGTITFKKENLPMLRTLSCKYKDGLLEEMYRYDIFDHLCLRTLNENVFERITPIKDLYALQINGGKLNNIDNISSLKTLRWLCFSSMPHLTNIDELAQMQDLEILDFLYCKHIKNWDFVLDMPKLKELKVTVSTRKDSPPQKILDALKEKGISAPDKGSS